LNGDRANAIFFIVRQTKSSLESQRKKFGSFRSSYAKRRVGEDPYACVIGANEKRTARYQIEQGLLEIMLPKDELFIGRE
jgi:hypothetical protein